MRTRGTTDGRRGSALVLALILVAVIASMGMVFLGSSTALSRRQADDLDQLRSFYLAEAGLAEAFQAVRIGRGGQVASAAAPARYGDGVLWVDSALTADDQIRLTSNGCAGRGRASLSLVLEPIDVPLGFFSAEDLVVESVVLVDGFDSQQGSYAEEAAKGILPEPVPQELASYLSGRCGGGLAHSTGHHMGLHNWCVGEYAHVPEEEYETPQWYLDQIASELDAVYAAYAEKARAAGADALYPHPTAAGVHTGGGGLLSSANDVVLDPASGEAVQVFGDVLTGVEGSVAVLGDAQVTGVLEPRPSDVLLPAVEVPSVPLAGAVRHEDLLPLLVSGGTFGFEALEVAADSELVLRGPATVVLGTLTLEAGALLTLDTRDGDVAVYVTQGMDLRKGALVTTTAQNSAETTIQVGAIPTDPAGPAIALEATSDFHGTLYAPEADVRIGADFEVYGGVVARKLEIAPGARLHFDRGRYADTPLPRIVGWRIVELPSALRATRRDPYAILGVRAADLPVLSEAQDLSRVRLAVTFLDANGATRSWSGIESDFDWGWVSQVLEVSRSASLVREGDGQVVDLAGPAPLTATNAVEAALATLTGPELRDSLIAASPLTSTEVGAVLAADTLDESALNDVLQAQDSIAGGTWLRLFSASGRLGSTNLRDLLLRHSPLGPLLLAAVKLLPETRLSASDKEAVLAAQE